MCGGLRPRHRRLAHGPSPPHARRPTHIPDPTISTCSTQLETRQSIWSSPSFSPLPSRVIMIKLSGEGLAQLIELLIELLGPLNHLLAKQLRDGGVAFGLCKL